MRVALVILNWNTRDYLRDFLPGLLASCKVLGRDAQGQPNAGVIVADNASGDGSADFVQSEFPEVGLIRFDRNYGFTGGYNRALAQTDAEYFVLVNSDVDVPEGWLGPLVEWMDSHPGCAICGPKLHALYRENGAYRRSGNFEYAGAAGGYVDRFGYPFCRGRVLKRIEADDGQYDDSADVLWVSGACLMVRRAVWQELGGFDGRFFAHMEEIDLCWRANRRGWKVNVVPGSVVYHLGGGTLPAASPFKLKLNYRNNLLLLEKNAGSRVLVFARMVLDGCSAVVYLLAGKTTSFKAVLEAHNEYRKLSTGTDRNALPLDGTPGAMRRLCILPIAAMKGKRIFKYLKLYEDRH